MSKKLLSLALALVMCLGLTIPASAAGTVKVAEDEEHGVKITMNGFLREETHSYSVYDDFTQEQTAHEFTINVVADNSTVTLEALEGRKYADASLQGLNKWTSSSFDRNSPEYVALQAFWDNQESYAYDGGESWGWDSELKSFRMESGPSWPLEKAVTNTISPTGENSILYLDLRYGIAWMCESDYAKLVPMDGGLPSQPFVGGFTDVKKGDYYAEPVLWAAANEVTTGTSATTFSPHQNCSVAQILTFLWRANGSPNPAGSNPFTDVKSGDYYEYAAAWAYEKGIVSGTVFGGSTPCTRSMAVTYIWKAAGSPSASAASFTDVSAGADYAQAVAWAVEQGVTAGTSATTFSPDSVCTRGQIVTFLYRALAE